MCCRQGCPVTFTTYFQTKLETALFSVCFFFCLAGLQHPRSASNSTPADINIRITAGNGFL